MPSGTLARDNSTASTASCMSLKSCLRGRCLSGASEVSSRRVRFSESDISYVLESLSLDDDLAAFSDSDDSPAEPSAPDDSPLHDTPLCTRRAALSNQGCGIPRQVYRDVTPAATKVQVQVRCGLSKNGKAASKQIPAEKKKRRRR